MKYDVYIGIDPDSVKSGVGIVERDTLDVDAWAASFSEIIDFFASAKERAQAENARVLIVVEAGWLNDSNWHLTPRDNKWQAAAKGKALGRCEQTGRLILEMAERIGLECVARKPLRKCWKGRDRKITHDEIKQFTHIQQSRTNQEERDALLLAWVEAGLPIRVKSS